MLLKYQEYFRGFSVDGILLKYDGKRVHLPFTVAFYDDCDVENTLCKDTDAPESTYSEFAKIRGFDLQSHSCEFFSLFKQSASRIIDFYGNQIIFVVVLNVKNVTLDVFLAAEESGKQVQLYTVRGVNEAALTNFISSLE